MKRQLVLSESEKSLIETCLRTAAMQFRADAATMANTAGHDFYARKFTDQASEATALLEMFAEFDRLILSNDEVSA